MSVVGCEVYGVGCVCDSKDGKWFTHCLHIRPTFAESSNPLCLYLSSSPCQSFDLNKKWAEAEAPLFLCNPKV